MLFSNKIDDIKIEMKTFREKIKELQKEDAENEKSYKKQNEELVRLESKYREEAAKQGIFGNALADETRPIMYRPAQNDNRDTVAQQVLFLYLSF